MWCPVSKKIKNKKQNYWRSVEINDTRTRYGISLVYTNHSQPVFSARITSTTTIWSSSYCNKALLQFQSVNIITIPCVWSLCLDRLNPVLGFVAIKQVDIATYIEFRVSRIYIRWFMLHPDILPPPPRLPHNDLLALEWKIWAIRWSSWWKSDRFCAQIQRHNVVLSSGVVMSF